MIIEDLQLLEHTPLAPLSCLDIAERYITPEVFGEIWNDTLGGKRDRINARKEIKNLKRALRRWEANHTSGFDIRNRRSH